MDNFNEEEIQRKIEEKRKRFIENAHRALGFYDQNILTSSEEHKKKRAEMMEKEFNKVFDEAGKPIRRYDEEPAKPLILAASKFPETHTSSSPDDKANKSKLEAKASYVESRKIDSDEDSLVTAQKELDLKLQPSVSTNDSSHKYHEGKVATPVITSAKTIEKDLLFEEEKKDAKSYDESITGSKKRSKEKAKNLKAKISEYSEDDNSDEDYAHSRQYVMKHTAVARNKKMRKFIVNTRHCRQERETLQYVIDLCRWYETTSIGEGDLIWYGVSLRDCDIDIIRSRPKLYFNRYPGSELLARK